MSNTVKLIIEIPKGVVEYIKNNGCLAVGYLDEVAKAIKNGTPLDDVKALIEYNAEIHEDGDSYLMEQWVYDILDGKYNADLPQAKRYRQGK
jgi:hypothetical protein